MGTRGTSGNNAFIVFSGQTNANFCPHGYGCRSLVVSEDQIILDVTDNDLTVVVRVPEGKQLWLVSLSPGSSQNMLGQASAEGFSLEFCHCVITGMFHTITQSLNYPRKLQSPTLVVWN